MMNLEIEKPILSIDAKNSVCYTEFFASMERIGFSISKFIIYAVPKVC